MVFLEGNKVYDAYECNFRYKWLVMSAVSRQSERRKLKCGATISRQLRMCVVPTDSLTYVASAAC